MKQSVIVYDDFLKEPEKLLTEFRSSKLRVLAGANDIFLRSDPSAFRPFLNREIEKVMGQEINFGTESDSGGEYRFTTAERHEKGKMDVVIHVDPKWNWNFIIYLSSESECGGGTGFFRHKETNLDGFYDAQAVLEATKRFKCSVDDLRVRLDRDVFDKSKWIQTDMVALKFNRLVAFEARMFHSHVIDFSRADKNAERITYISFGRKKND